MDDLEFEIVYFYRSGSILKDFEYPIYSREAPDPAIIEILSKIDAISCKYGVSPKRRTANTDNTRHKQYQFPTIDTSTLEYVTYAISGLAAIKLLLKDIQGILDEAVKLVRKARKARKEITRSDEPVPSLDHILITVKINGKKYTVKEGDDITKLVQEASVSAEGATEDAKKKQTPSATLAKKNKRIKQSAGSKSKKNASLSGKAQDD